MLQLATQDCVFVFDMMELEDWHARGNDNSAECTWPGFKSLIMGIFATKTIIGVLVKV